MGLHESYPPGSSAGNSEGTGNSILAPLQNKRPWPASTRRSWFTSRGTLKPKVAMLFAICSTCFLLWRRGLEEFGLTSSIAR